MTDRISELSEIQKSCLRLVAANRTSKEIAIDVGLSHMTVDQYLSRATALLGAANRRDAARILSEVEAEKPFKQFEFKPQPLVEKGDSAISGASVADRTGPHYPTRWHWLMGQLARQMGGPRHELSAVEVIMTIMRISLFSSAVMAMMIAAVYWLNLLFT